MWIAGTVLWKFAKKYLLNLEIIYMEPLFKAHFHTKPVNDSLLCCQGGQIVHGA